MILYEDKKTNKKLIVGTIEDVRTVNFQQSERMVATVVDRDNKKVSVVFKDDLKRQAEAANITKGVWFTVLVDFMTEDAGNALEFKYKGWWFLDAESSNGKPVKTNVFVGSITSPKKVSDKCFIVSIPLDVYDKETKLLKTEWKLVKFVNSQAAFAEKLLGNGTHYGAVVCGDRKFNEYNGNIEYYYFGNKVELRLDSNTEGVEN